MDSASRRATHAFARGAPKSVSHAIRPAQATGFVDPLGGLCRQAIEGSGLSLGLIEFSFDLHGQPCDPVGILGKPPLLLQQQVSATGDEGTSGATTLDWLDESAMRILSEVLRDRQRRRFLHKATSIQAWIDVRAMPIDNAARNQVLVLFEDVTARQQELASLRLQKAIAIDAENANAAYRLELEQQMDAQPFGLMMHDPSGLLRHANSTARGHWSQDLPREPQDYEGLNARWAPGSAQAGTMLKGDDWPLARAMRQGCVASGCIELFTGEHSEHPIVLQVWVTPVRDGQQRITGFVQASLDVTRQTEALKSLQNDVRCKDDFITMLVHELRNPLAPIKTAAQTLAAKEVRHSQDKRSIQIILRQASHLSRLIDDMTDLRKIQCGVLNVEPETVDVRTLVREAIEQVQPLIDQQGHALRVSEAPSPLEIHADPRRIIQIFSNLLTNAARYTPPGGLIEVETAGAAGRAVVTVRDNGFGMSPEFLGQAFNAYTRGIDAQKGAQEGFGIGLTLVKSLVDMHHGQLHASSGGLGRGCEFTVEFPLHLDSDCHDAKGRPLILVADDNRDTADSMGMLLEMHGYETMSAYSGSDALEKAQTRPPAVCIVDMLMPDMNGDQVVRQLRKRQELGQTVFVALTGMNERMHGAALAQAGFDHVFSKPIDTEQLLRLLDDSTGLSATSLDTNVPTEKTEMHRRCSDTP